MVLLPRIKKGVFTVFYSPVFHTSAANAFLHLHSKFPNDDRHSEFLSDPITERNYKPATFIKGINLTSNDENKALAMRLIMILDTPAADPAPQP